MSLNVMWFVPPAVAMAADALAVPGHDGLTATRTRGSDEQYETLVSKRCDAVVTAMDNVFAWNRRPDSPGDFCIVAEIEQTTPLAVVGRPRFASLAELEGAELLVDAPGNGFVIALQALLLDAGVGPQAYRLAVAGGVKERFDALVAGRGDATLLGTGFDRAAVASGLRLIDSVQARYPEFPGQGLVVSRRELPRIGAALRAWIAALDEACRRTVADPQATRAALARLPGVDAAGVDIAMAALPASLAVRQRGFDLLVAMRKRLGLPGGDDRHDDLVSSACLPSHS